MLFGEFMRNVTKRNKVDTRKAVRAMSLLMLALACSWLCAAQQQPQQAPASGASPAPSAAQSGAQPGAPAQTTAPPAGAAPATSAKPLSREAARRDAWKMLNEGIAEKTADRRAQAISALGTIGVRPDVVHLVESGLDDSSLDVRQIAAATLGDMKSRGSIPKLRAALDDDSAAVSFTAAQALWAMNDHSGLSIFIQVLAGERKAAPGLIQKNWHDMKNKLRDPRALTELGAAEAAGAFLGPGGLGVTVIAELAKDKTSGARALSARLLARDNSPDSHEALEQALDEKSWVVRASAAEALGRQGAPHDIDKLSPLLEDSRPEVRYSAAAAIVRLAPRRPS
jgi:HEAT repeat protein